MARSRPLLLVSALGLLGARVAVAQPSRHPHPRHPLTPPPAAPVVTPPPAPAGPAEPSAADIENARRLFREGVDFFQRQQWANARDRFLRANRVRSAPLVRFNLGLACHNLGYFNDAIEAYRQFLTEAPTSAEWLPRREAAAREIAELERRRAWLRVRVEGDEVRSLRLDGVAMPVASLGDEIPLDPGIHHIDVEGAGGEHALSDNRVPLAEGEHAEATITLEPRAAMQSARADAGWQTRTQTFGRAGIARNDAAFTDWAQHEAPELSQTWARRPFTVAAQFSLNAATGLVGLSARYFPQPWFGVELAGGALGTQKGIGAGLLAHLRVPFAAPSRWAIGLFAGPAVSDFSMSFHCNQRDNCVDQSLDRSEHVLGLWVSAGATVEWRFSTRWSLRAMAGVQRFLNPATVRNVVDHASYECVSTGGTGFAPCAVYTGTTSPSLTQPFVALDLGFSP